MEALTLTKEERFMRFAKSYIRLGLTAVLTLCLTISFGASRAQGGAHVVAQVTADNNSPAVLQLFPAIDSPLSKAPQLPIGASATVSADLNWLVVQGYDTTTQAMFFTYQQTGAAKANLVPVEKDFSANSPNISADSRFLTYTTISNQIEAGKWALNFLNLETGTRTTLTSQFTFEVAKATDKLFYGVAYVLSGWTASDKRVLLGSFIPFADGNFQNFYALDLTGIDLNKGGTFALPKVTLLTKVGTVFSDLQITPDRKTLAYVMIDPSVTPDNFEAMGPYPLPFNLVRLMDNASGKVTELTTNKKQGIGNLAWSTDGKRLYFTAGAYNKTDYIVTPRLDSVEAASGKITPGPALTTDVKEIITQIEVCGDTLFYVSNTRTPDGAPGTTSLYVAPIAKPNQRTELAKALVITLLQCAP